MHIILPLPLQPSHSVTQCVRNPASADLRLTEVWATLHPSVNLTERISRCSVTSDREIVGAWMTLGRKWMVQGPLSIQGNTNQIAVRKAALLLYFLFR